MIRLTKLALRRPVTIILCLITIAYFGLQSVMGMKLELTPEMEMPMLIIATVYPGASPEDVTDLVTKKEEDAITSLDSVDKVQSISRENVSIVIVQYEYGTNMDTAYINLKKAIDGIQSDLPDDANDPNIMELDINSMATVTLAVSGDADQNLYTYVDDKIVPEFEKLSSVGEVSIAGGQDSYTRVELIPEKLAQYHLNMNTVAQLVGAADFTIPGGRCPGWKTGSRKMSYFRWQTVRRSIFLISQMSMRRWRMQARSDVTMAKMLSPWESKNSRVPPRSRFPTR